MKNWLAAKMKKNNNNSIRLRSDCSADGILVVYSLLLFFGILKIGITIITTIQSTNKSRL